jgi:methyl-accepting chemotaxis protein
MGVPLIKHGISLKRVILIVMLFLSVSALAGWELISYRNSMMEDRKQKTKNMVDSVYGLVAFYQSKVAKEGISNDDAKQSAIQSILQLPHDENAYFWINDVHNVMIMHPFQPEMVGMDYTNFTDANGKYIFHDFLDTVKTKQAGFVTYVWPKPDDPSGKVYPKLSYVKGFEPWNWIIGSGIYIDDVDTAFGHAVTVTGGLSAAVFVLFIVFAFTVLEGFKKP